MVEVLQRTPSGRAIDSRLASSELVAPELLDVEVAASFRKSVLRGEASVEDAIAALEVLRDWEILRVPHGPLLIDSIKWWSNVTAYDATYLAVAAAFGATVLTVDGSLSRSPITDVLIENVTVGR